MVPVALVPWLQVVVVVVAVLLCIVGLAMFIVLRAKADDSDGIQIQVARRRTHAQSRACWPHSPCWWCGTRRAGVDQARC